ncbi:helix-turn-helix domain-containing protein [Dactylosporangium sp. AC04546]|uniref:helix-turn-helix domain-containing protein n=1 Tax=Dactylosporangium sp. AC04546 TaxID=2862460 RepID=UPI002E7BEBB2|nr:LysR family transcriptional regulator [Dactylosporangium sp. AC04546]
MALNFARAAEELRVAQPSLSRQIQRLEDALGVRLLERTTQGSRRPGDRTGPGGRPACHPPGRPDHRPGRGDSALPGRRCHAPGRRQPVGRCLPRLGTHTSGSVAAPTRNRCVAGWNQSRLLCACRR